MDIVDVLDVPEQLPKDAETVVGGSQSTAEDSD